MVQSVCSFREWERSPVLLLAVYTKLVILLHVPTTDSSALRLNLAVLEFSSANCGAFVTHLILIATLPLILINFCVSSSSLTI